MSGFGTTPLNYFSDRAHILRRFFQPFYIASFLSGWSKNSGTLKIHICSFWKYPMIHWSLDLGPYSKKIIFSATKPEFSKSSNLYRFLVGMELYCTLSHTHTLHLYNYHMYTDVTNSLKILVQVKCWLCYINKQGIYMHQAYAPSEDSWTPPPLI